MDAALIPTGHEAQSYVCVRSLKERGIDTIVASEKAGVPAAASRYCDESVELPPPKEDLVAYRDALLELADRPAVGTVVPIRPEDGYVLSKYRDSFAERVSLPVPSMDQLRTVHDRLHLAEAAEEAGVPVPETRCFEDVTDWESESIVKTRYNLVAGEYVDRYDPAESAVVKEVKHLDPGTEPDVEAIREEYGHDPIVQEFVPKDGEYMFAGLYDHGKPLATFQHKQIRGNSYTGGGGVYRRSTDIPELETVARDLLEHLEWHGLACIEYMRDERTGEFVLTEINPRMWQSLPSTVRAGVDFPHYYWLQAMDRAEEIDPEYDVGVGSHLLHGELGHLLSIVTEDSPLVTEPSFAGTAWAIVSSCVTEPYFDYLRFDDPGPFLQGVRNKIPSVGEEVDRTGGARRAEETGH